MFINSTNLLSINILPNLQIIKRTPSFSSDFCKLDSFVETHNGSIIKIIVRENKIISLDC